MLEAADAEEALAILETEPDIQMVFSDIVMPGDRDGFGLARWIAAHRPGVKCLLATGHHERASDAPTGDAPPLPVLRKPYSKKQLAHQIRQLLDERARREAGDVASGQWRLPAGAETRAAVTKLYVRSIVASQNRVRLKRPRERSRPSLALEGNDVMPASRRHLLRASPRRLLGRFSAFWADGPSSGEFL